MAWFPHAIAETALSAGGGADVQLAEAWAQLLERLSAAEQLTTTTSPDERARVIDGRRQAVHERFYR